MKRDAALELCLDRITGQFETGGDWGKVTNNFDGFGPSVGIIQFAWGMGTLQNVIRIFKSENKLSDYFDGVCATELEVVLDRPLEVQKRHAAEHWFDGEVWKDQEMKAGFKRMAASKAFRRAQIEGVRYYSTIALTLHHIGGFETVRAFAIMFDIAVQNGGVSRELQREILEFISSSEITHCTKFTEKAKLKIWIDVRVSKASEQWREDVRARKYAILEGAGFVHGTPYLFDTLNLDEKLETT